MKTPGSRPPHDTLQTALRSAFPLDARRLAVFTALVLAVIQARTVVLYSLKTHVALPGSLTARYQRLIRFGANLNKEGAIAKPVERSYFAQRRNETTAKALDALPEFLIHELLVGCRR